MRYIRFVFLPVLLFSLFSCSDNENGIEPDTFKRTVIVYLGRDNNLSGHVDNKFESMLEGWNGKNGHLVIYQDTAKGNAGLMEAYREGGVNKVKTIREYEDDNSASPETLRRVIHDAMGLYPADSYGLIVFSHATGWLPGKAYESPRSLIPDKTDIMELTAFASAIPDGCFEFIVFEACLMAGIEVAYELKDKTDYIIASSAELLRPGFQEIYVSSINYLFEEQPKLEAFTKDVFNLFNTNSNYYQSGTFSLIKTAGLRELRNFLQTNIAPEKMAAVDPFDVQHFDFKSYHLFYDFEDYFSRILKDEASLQELSSLIGKCVVYKAATAEYYLDSYRNFKINHHSGLTAYIPQDIFPFLNESYKSLSWNFFPL